MSVYKANLMIVIYEDGILQMHDDDDNLKERKNEFYDIFLPQDCDDHLKSGFEASC